MMEAAVIGVPDLRTTKLSQPLPCIRREEASEKEIIEFCRKCLSGYKVPKVVEFRDSLPKSPIGKILRRVLREEEIKSKMGGEGRKWKKLVIYAPLHQKS